MVTLIFGEVRKAVSRTDTLDFQWAYFRLYRDMMARVLWEAVLKGKGVQTGYTFFENEISKMQDVLMPKS